MVTDNDIDSLAAGILHFLDGLDAAVQRNNQVHAIVGRPVQGLVREAVAFVVAVRDIERELLGEILEEGIQLGHSRGAVYVVVAVNQDLLLAHDGLVQTLYGLVHILHQERIVQVFQLRAEETAGFFKVVYATLDQKVGQNPVNAEFCSQFASLLCVGRRLNGPLFFCDAHSLTKIGNPQQNYKQEIIISSVTSWGVKASVSMVTCAAARYSGSRWASLSAKPSPERGRPSVWPSRRACRVWTSACR